MGLVRMKKEIQRVTLHFPFSYLLDYYHGPGTRVNVPVVV